MKLSRLLSLIRKEFIQIVRDPRTLAITFAMPLLQIFLLGYAATNDVRNVLLAVWDQDRSWASRQLLDAYRASDYFRVGFDVGSESELRRLIDTGQARAGVDQAQAGIIQASAAVSQTEAALTSASAGLRAEEARLDLMRAGARPEQVKVAEAQVAAAHAQAEAASGQVAAARAGLDVIDEQLARMTIHAPADGVVLSRAIEPGEVALPGGALFVLGDLEHLTVTVYVPEDRYGTIRIGQPAQVTVDSFPSRVFAGTVQRIADRGEFTPRNVQTPAGRRAVVYAVKVAVDNSDGELKLGMPADITFGQ